MMMVGGKMYYLKNPVLALLSETLTRWVGKKKNKRAKSCQWRSAQVIAGLGSLTSCQKEKKGGQHFSRGAVAGTSLVYGACVGNWKLMVLVIWLFQAVLVMDSNVLSQRFGSPAPLCKLCPWNLIHCTIANTLSDVVVYRTDKSAHVFWTDSK